MLCALPAAVGDPAGRPVTVFLRGTWSTRGPLLTIDDRILRASSGSSRHPSWNRILEGILGGVGPS